MLPVVLAVALGVAGCAGPDPSPSNPPGTSAPSADLGGYADLGEACTSVAGDLITLHRIAGTVQVGLDGEGAEAIGEELRAMRILAPAALLRSYRALETAIERVPLPPDGPTPSPTRSPTTGQAVAVIDATITDVTEWLRESCDAE